MSFVWSYRQKEISISCCIAASSTLTLVRGEDNGIIVSKDDLTFAVDPDDIAKVIFMEPKLFKKGWIAFYDSNDDVLNYICDGRSIDLAWHINKKDKDIFFAIFSIFKENGFEVECY